MRTVTLKQLYQLIETGNWKCNQTFTCENTGEELGVPSMKDCYAGTVVISSVCNGITITYASGYDYNKVDGVLSLHDFEEQNMAYNIIGAVLIDNRTDDNDLDLNHHCDDIPAKFKTIDLDKLKSGIINKIKEVSKWN